MSQTLIDLKAERERALSSAEEIVSRAESQKRQLSFIENEKYNKCMTQANDLRTEIDRITKAQTPTDRVKQFRQTHGMRSTNVFTPGKGVRESLLPKTLSSSYAEAFYNGLAGGGWDKMDPAISAALNEGTNSAGGYAVPIEVDKNIVPLMPNDGAVRKLALVVPTTADRRVARITGLPTATAKAEGSAFGASVSTFGQFTLSAFMEGIECDASIELFEDVPLFQATTLRDNTFAFQVYEEGKYISGSGTGEAQGLLGNTDVGVAAAVADGGGNLFSVASTFDILSTLKDPYHDNASWLMSRAAAISLRKAQLGTGLFEKVFTRENGIDLLHGYPVKYSASMPTVSAGNTVALFGDFQSGYIIGDRGGSAVRMKVLDQKNMVNGVITLLIFRRTDGRVRNPEAIKALTLHS